MPFDLPSDTQETTLKFGTPPVSAPVKHTVVPQAYYPGADAPVRVAQENSFWGNFTTALQNAGTQPGEIPVSMKMRLAQQQADINISQDKLAWENYHRANDAFNETVRLHNQNAAEHALTLFPNAKAQIRNASTPEEAQALAAFHGKALESLLPGAQDYMVKYGATRDSMAAGDAFDIVLASPTYGPLMKPLVDNLGYLQASQLPQVKAWGEIVGRDTITNVVSHMPESFITKLTTGKVGEEEFRKEYEKNLLDPSMKFNAQSLSHAKQALNSEIGQQMMIGMGVKTNAVAEKQQLKGPTSGNPMQQARVAELHNIEATLTNPNLSKDERAKLTTDRRVLLLLQAKEAAPSQAANNLNASMIQVSKGQYSNWGEYADALKEDPSLVAIGAQAQKQAATMNPQAATNVRLDTPQNVAQKDIYETDALVQGKLVNVKHPVTARDLTTGKYVQLEKADKSQLQQLAQSTMQAHDLFHTATGLFKANTSWDVTKQKAVEADIQTFGWLGAAARHDPMWQVYVKQLNAWASTDARILGTERGVMTNTDIDRWTSVFPNASDTAMSVKKKIELFDKMVSYVVKTNIQVMAGTLDLTDPAAAQKNRDTIEGFLGNAEQLGGTSQKPINRGQSLLEKMKAE